MFIDIIFTNGVKMGLHACTKVIDLGDCINVVCECSEYFSRNYDKKEIEKITLEMEVD